MKNRLSLKTLLLLFTVTVAVLLSSCAKPAKGTASSSAPEASSIEVSIEASSEAEATSEPEVASVAGSKAPAASSKAAAVSRAAVSTSGPTVGVPSFKTTQAIHDIGMCVTDVLYDRDTADIVKKRCNLYKDYGLRTIRIATLWGAVEPREGVFNNPPEERYLKWYTENGLRLKIILGTTSVIPSWYFSRYPDCYMVNDEGKKALGTITYLLPGLRGKIDTAVDRMVKYYVDNGLIGSVDSMVIDMGTSGEGLYPPAWTQVPGGLLNPPVNAEKFWCYDPYMQADFKKVMQAKYKTIDAANKAWGKAYASFDALEVPKPGTVTGTMWNDVLTWYRQVKRDFMEENVKSYKKAVDKYTNGRVKLIIYIPGREIRDNEWQDAVNTGIGNDSIKLMADSRFIIDLAGKYGCYLQYTGAENVTEINFLVKYMYEKNLQNIPLFGENSGSYNVGKNMKRYVENLKQYGLAGIDITHSQWIHDTDHFSPTASHQSIKDNLQLLSAYLKTGL